MPEDCHLKCNKEAAFVQVDIIDEPTLNFTYTNYIKFHFNDNLDNF